MKIKYLLKITIFFIIFISVYFGISIYFSLQGYKESVNKSDIAKIIVLKVSERKILADEYLLHTSERAKIQWFSKQEDIKVLISSNESIFKNDDEKELVAQIKSGLSGSEQVFENAVALYDETTTTPERMLLDEQKRRTSSLLGFKAQETISAASNLADINGKYAAQRLDQIVYLFSTTASVFFVLLLISFWIIWKGASEVEQGDERLQFISKATKDTIYDWDIVKNTLWFGEGMQKSFGYTKGQIQQTLEWWSAHLHPEDRERINTELDEVLKGNKNNIYINYRFEHADGHYSYVQDRAYLQRNRHGKPIRYIGVMEDVSREKELEKMKDEFVSVASHELRTPMTAIKGLVSMLLEGDYGKISDELTSPLKDIEVSTNRLIALVNDLLDLARIQSGRTKFMLSEVPVDATIKQIASLLQTLAKQKGIEILVKDIPQVVVQVDADKLQEIMNNIIGNAIKFTDVGNITISGLQENDLVKIFVTDTGIGISSENKSRLFGKFQQVSSTKAGRPKGTGLGLYISRELARKMGGDLWIEKSEVGNGSVFGFSIPLATSAKAAKVKGIIDKEAQFHLDQK